MRTELTDGHVTLRRHHPDRAPALFEAVMQSLPEASRWMSWCHADLTLADQRAWLEAQVQAWARGEAYEFAVLDATSGELIGGAGLNQLHREYRMANLGYWVRTSATGRGAATAAARLLAHFGFEALELMRLEIVVALGNAPSLRVAEKLGARREGVLRNRIRLHGRSVDAVMYSLIPADL